MTPDMLRKIIELIDAKIAEALARDSSDGGLVETLKVSAIEAELLALVEQDND